MIDLHTHILPGLDDGAPDIDTALKMAAMAVSDRTGQMIATPHFINGEIDNNRNKVEKVFEQFNRQLLVSKIKLKLYPGSEVFISPELPSLLEEGIVYTLNNSCYVLVELPMTSRASYAREVIYQLRLKGYIPVIAHPERYKYIADDTDIVYDYIQAGALMQVNSTSLNGLYGSAIRELSLKMLRHGMVHFVASDAHTCRGRAPKLSKACDLVADEVGSELSEALFSENAQKVLSNLPLEVPAPTRISNSGKSFFPFFKRVIAGILK